MVKIRQSLPVLTMAASAPSRSFKCYSEVPDCRRRRPAYRPPVDPLRTSIALTIAVVACSAASIPRGYITPSYALAHADELDGRKVTVGGFVDIGTNSRCLYDSLRAVRGRNGTGSQVITLSEGDNLLRRRAELNHRFVLATGIFKKTFNGPEVIDLYKCNDAGIEQETVRLSHR